ncbi:hypothetical protein [Psychrobacter sp. M13]|uniref:hypothetical protein n=1 Tax=Psychrobacter sp. M13 TaxID=3067275 RepID=UPI00273ADE2D|nr:hypothetical protein [Psychrobacter sp. M13]WLP94337.1 hypothetical protein Q9G97_12280 [Psychrobacter sp. M13]
MNNSQVFQKSALGREKIKNKELDILPRQARTLLFLIDGESHYDSYLKSLDSSEIFAESGGVAVLFELLQDLQYIEVASSDQGEPTETSLFAASETATLSDEDAQRVQNIEVNVAAGFETEIETEPKELSDDEKHYYDKNFNADFESKRAELAAYIEQKAPGQEAWVYMLSLEKCDNILQLQALVQHMQSSANDNLADGIQKFYETLN